ncbi:hypothetical protein GCM10012279_09530 [Micromonospora yangpuensis]|nr:hypothetical protein [Micromonospora yangpuensis]GGL94062.1 hypothetical protein GCM10012279_09530 [Micromonospora yangpuensis]
MALGALLGGLLLAPFDARAGFLLGAALTALALLLLLAEPLLPTTGRCRAAPPAGVTPVPARTAREIP